MNALGALVAAGVPQLVAGGGIAAASVALLIVGGGISVAWAEDASVAT